MGRCTGAAGSGGDRRRQRRLPAEGSPAGPGVASEALARRRVAPAGALVEVGTGRITTPDAGIRPRGRLEATLVADRGVGPDRELPGLGGAGGGCWSGAAPRSGWSGGEGGDGGAADLGAVAWQAGDSGSYGRVVGANGCDPVGVGGTPRSEQPAGPRGVRHRPRDGVYPRRSRAGGAALPRRAHWRGPGAPTSGLARFGTDVASPVAGRHPRGRSARTPCAAPRRSSNGLPGRPRRRGPRRRTGWCLTTAGG